jgi:hypothetical protein
MPRYRKKPVEIEAQQFGGFVDDASDVTSNVWPESFSDAAKTWRRQGAGLIIPTLEGQHIATPGDFIIRGVKGEFYPCKPDIFAATYDKVEG